MKHIGHILFENIPFAEKHYFDKDAILTLKQ